MKISLAFLFVILWGVSATAQDLPPEILADQYLLAANKAIEEGNTQSALQMFRKIEALAIEKPPEFAYFYGKLLVENSTALADLRKGHTYLKQFVLSVGRESEHYRPTLELLTAAEEKLEKAAAEEAQRQVEAQRQAARRQAEAQRQAEIKAQLPQLLAILDQQMVRIPGGTFTMGCTREESDWESVCSDDEKPAHQVRVRDFEISKYEVTQELWEAVMGTNPSRFSDCAQCPVETVSWDDIQGFLRILNAGGGPYRLPSEAEWEYAARGGQQSRGYQYAGGNSPAAVAWYNVNSGYRTHPVGQKQANELGLYDMSGNVSEWVQDCWNSSYQGAPSDGRAWEQGDCSRRVLRDGSFYVYSHYLYPADRDRHITDFRNDSFGFRLARTPS